MNKRLKIFFLLLLLLVPVAAATLSTYRHAAFVVADGKGIDLNGNSLENGTFANITGSYARDTAGGVAGLNGNGDILVPGTNVLISRGASNAIALGEQTSNEPALVLIRNSKNDYTGYIGSSAFKHIIQTSDMKDIVNGIAGLDANAQVVSANLNLTGAVVQGANITVTNNSDGTVTVSSGGGTADNNASSLLYGTLDDARLSSNVNLNNASTINTGTLGLAYIPHIPVGNYTTGSDVYHAHDAEVSVAQGDTTWGLLKKITLYQIPSSTLRIYFESRTTAASYPSDGQIYRNGVAVGTLRYGMETYYTSYTENIANWSVGDTLELWGKMDTPTGAGYYRNFRILYNASSDDMVNS